MADLLEMPHLRLTLDCGSGGVGREITWGHTSDLPEPWQWLSGGELLMINGLSFPGNGDEQARWLTMLDEVGASGLAIGEQMGCPALSARFRARADELGFPVLWIRYPLPFVAISRAIAEATLIEQSGRLTRTARIYDAVHRTAREGGDRSRVSEAIGRELRCEVHVCDRATGRSFFPGGPVPPDVVQQAVTGAGGVPVAGGRKVTGDGAEVRVVEIPTEPTAALAVVRRGSAPLDGSLLQHAATVAALELSHTRIALDYRRRSGAEFLRAFLDGRTDPQSARERIRALALAPAGTVVVAIRAADPDALADLHLTLWRHRVPHAVIVNQDTGLALLPDRDEVIAALAAGVGSRTAFGISAPLRSVTRATAALREATWALGVAEQTGQPSARFGAQAPLPGLSDFESAESLVERWIAPLERSDAQHSTELLRTLQAFLDHRRSWQRTAAALQVHRQTVLYRIRRIEELTGADLADTADIAQFWLALRAKRFLCG